MRNFLNTNTNGGVKSFICKKDLKQRKKMVFLKLTCYSLEKFLISRYTSILDNRKQEYHCNCPLFTFRSTSQGVKYRLKQKPHLTIANLHWEVLKNFKKCTQQKLDAWTF